jgi:hypothetical protein
MKLLMENWRKYLKEQAESVDNLTDEEILASLFDDDVHPSGRPYGDEFQESPTLQEQEQENLNQILQDFLKVSQSYKSSSVGNEDLTAFDDKIRALRTEAIDKADTVISYGTSLSNLENSINEALEAFNAYFDELEGTLMKVLDVYKGSEQQEINNYFSVVNAIRLFTGENLATTRDPSKYDPRRARHTRKSYTYFEEMILHILGDTYTRQTIYEFQQHLNQKHNKDVYYLMDRMDKIRDLSGELFLETKNTKEDYEFANRFLTWVARHEPPVLVEAGLPLYRGTAASEQKFKRLERMAPGTTVRHHNLTSWSLSQKVAIGFAIDGSYDAGTPNKFLILNRTPATRGLHVEDYSAYKNEKEVIAGGNLKVVKIEKKQLGQYNLNFLVIDFEYI